MKKLFTTLLTLALLAALAVPACAVTPRYRPPKLPKVPAVQVHVELSEGYLERYLKEHPLNF